MTRFSDCCAPNTSLVLNGRQLQLRAIKPIDVNQEITFSYIPLTISQIERQKNLRNIIQLTANVFDVKTNSHKSIDY
jgi:hypothetical protein